MAKVKSKRLTYGDKKVSREVWRSVGKRTLRQRVIGVGITPLIPCDGDEGYSDDKRDHEVEGVEDAFMCDSTGVEIHYLCKLKNLAGLWWISFVHLTAAESVEDFIGRYGCYTCKHTKKQTHCSNCLHKDRVESAIREKLKKTTAELDAANRKLKDAQAKLTTLERLEEMKMAGPAAQQGIADAKTEVQKLSAQVQDLLREVEAKIYQNEMLQGRVNKLTAENEALREDITSLREENTSLKERLNDRDEVLDFMVNHGRTVDESLDESVAEVTETELRTLAPPPSTKELEAIETYCRIRGASSTDKKAQKRILYRIRKKIEKANE